MIKTVPVVRGVAPLVDLASSNMEALRLLGGADGRDGEEAHHSWGDCPCGAAPDVLRAGRAYQRVPVSLVG